ncbi:hypothetical protein ACFLRF_03005 [Candidatus Altiarchaeota archaeon]
METTLLKKAMMVMAVLVLSSITVLALYPGSGGRELTGVTGSAVSGHHCESFTDADGDGVCDNQDTCEKHNGGGCDKYKEGGCGRHKASGLGEYNHTGCWKNKEGYNYTGCGKNKANWTGEYASCEKNKTKALGETNYTGCGKLKKGGCGSKEYGIFTATDDNLAGIGKGCGGCGKNKANGGSCGGSG